jgi:hypothetical protein
MMHAHPAGLKKSLKLWHVVIMGLAYLTPMAVFDTFGIVTATEKLDDVHAELTNNNSWLRRGRRTEINAGRDQLFGFWLRLRAEDAVKVATEFVGRNL